MHVRSARLCWRSWLSIFSITVGKKRSCSPDLLIMSVSVSVVEMKNACMHADSLSMAMGLARLAY